MHVLHFLRYLLCLVELTAVACFSSTIGQLGPCVWLQVSPSLFKDNVKEGSFTFLPVGPVPDQTLDKYRASIGAPPQQPVKYTHRFHLAQVANHVRPFATACHVQARQALLQ